MDPSVSLIECPGTRPAVECPAQLPEGARRVCIVHWVYGPGWLVEYLISSNRGGTLWILWARDDRGGWFEEWDEAVPFAWCPCRGVTREVAARALLGAWWRHLRDRNQGQPGPLEELSGMRKEDPLADDGLLSFDTLAQLREELWPGG